MKNIIMGGFMKQGSICILTSERFAGKTIKKLVIEAGTDSSRVPAWEHSYGGKKK